jgi:hypothetical protein
MLCATTTPTTVKQGAIFVRPETYRDYLGNAGAKWVTPDP